MVKFFQKKQTAEKPTVLVVDDDETIQMIVQARLGQVDGLNVIGVVNPEEGLEIAARQQPDLILLDWVMPEMSGPDFLAKLTANEKTAEIPVVMLTGKDRMGDVEIATAYGAVHYITKPLDLPALSRRVLGVLNKASEPT